MLSKPVIGDSSSGTPKFSSKKFDFYTFKQLADLPPAQAVDTIKRASLQAILFYAAARLQKEDSKNWSKEDLQNKLEQLGLKSFLGPSANSYFSYFSKHPWRGKQFIQKVGEDKYTLPEDVLAVGVKIPKVKELGKNLSFIGTSKVSETVHGKSTSKSEMIAQGLKHNDEALLYFSAAQIVGEAYGSLKENPNPELEKQLNVLTKKPVTNTTLEELAVLQMQTVSAEKPKKYYVPKTWLNAAFSNTYEMYSTIKSITGENFLEKSKLQTVNSKVDEYPFDYYTKLSEIPSGFFNDEVSPTTNKAINVAHQTLNGLLKSQVSNIKLSKRIVITNPNLEKSKKISAFVEAWKEMGAENLIGQTTGTSNAGVIFSPEGSNKIDGQIQVGEVNQHSIVLHDDSKIVHLKYHDASSTRAELLRDVFNAAGFSANLSGSHDVIATAKSRPRTYTLLARIIPNTVDLDLGTVGTQTAAGRKATIEAMLKGYPVTGKIRDDLYPMKNSYETLMKVMKGASKVLAVPPEKFSQSAYELKIAELAGTKKIKQAALKEQADAEKKIKTDFKPGTIVYSTSGGYAGQKGVVQKIENNMVWVKFDYPDSNMEKKPEYHDGLYDKSPEKISLKPPPGFKDEKPESLKKQTDDLELKSKPSIGNFNPVSDKMGLAVTGFLPGDFGQVNKTNMNELVEYGLPSNLMYKVVTIGQVGKMKGVYAVAVKYNGVSYWIPTKFLSKFDTAASKEKEKSYSNKVGFSKFKVGDTVQDNKKLGGNYEKYKVEEVSNDGDVRLSSAPGTISLNEGWHTQEEMSEFSLLGAYSVPGLFSLVHVYKNKPVTVHPEQPLKLPYFGKSKFNQLLALGATYDWDNKTFKLHGTKPAEFLEEEGIKITVDKGGPVIGMVTSSNIVTPSKTFHVGDYVENVSTGAIFKIQTIDTSDQKITVISKEFESSNAPIKEFIDNHKNYKLLFNEKEGFKQGPSEMAATPKIGDLVAMDLSKAGWNTNPGDSLLEGKIVAIGDENLSKYKVSVTHSPTLKGESSPHWEIGNQFSVDEESFKKNLASILVKGVESETGLKIDSLGTPTVANIPGIGPVNLSKVPKYPKVVGQTSEFAIKTGQVWKSKLSDNLVIVQGESDYQGISIKPAMVKDGEIVPKPNTLSYHVTSEVLEEGYSLIPESLHNYKSTLTSQELKKELDKL